MKKKLLVNHFVRTYERSKKIEFHINSEENKEAIFFPSSPEKGYDYSLNQTNNPSIEEQQNFQIPPIIPIVNPNIEESKKSIFNNLLPLPSDQLDLPTQRMNYSTEIKFLNYPFKNREITLPTIPQASQKSVDSSWIPFHTNKRIENVASLVSTSYKNQTFISNNSESIILEFENEQQIKTINELINFKKYSNYFSFSFPSINKLSDAIPNILSIIYLNSLLSIHSSTSEGYSLFSVPFWSFHEKLLGNSNDLNNLKRIMTLSSIDLKIFMEFYERYEQKVISYFMSKLKYSIQKKDDLESICFSVIKEIESSLKIPISLILKSKDAFKKLKVGDFSLPLRALSFIKASSGQTYSLVMNIFQLEPKYKNPRIINRKL